MQNSSLGAVLALSASAFWTLTPIFLASAGRRIGAYQTNIVRLGMAGAALIIISGGYLAAKGGGEVFSMVPLPAFLWLVLSGLTGLVLGDILYLRALSTLGPRRTTLTITLAPVVPVVIAWIFIGEKLAWPVLAGIALIIGGIAYTAANENIPETDGTGGEPGSFSKKNLAVAVGGTFFHGSGAVMARQAFLSAPEIDPVTATAVRVVSSAVIMSCIAACTGHLFKAAGQLRSPAVLLRVALGTLSGPVIGMIFYVSAFKYTAAGIVTTLSGLSPVLILPVIAFRYRVRIRREAVFGAVLAVAGVAIMVLVT
jgi:drug/metabolite transporter (DMT)-like permease